MKEAYVVCEERNNDAAFRRFFGPGYCPGTHEIVRSALRHRVTTGILLAMFAVGLVGCVAVLSGAV